MKTFQQFCEPKTKELGAPVGDVSPTITRWANEYGEYCAGYEGECDDPEPANKDNIGEKLLLKSGFYKWCDKQKLKPSLTLDILLADEYAKQVATELLLGMHSYRLNGIGEIQQVHNYELGDTDLTVDDVIAISALEFEENDEVVR